MLESEAKTVRNVSLKAVKNLRSQVCRAAVQAVQVVFLHLGKALEPDSDGLVKELLQKSADTNKFLRFLQEIIHPCSQGRYTQSFRFKLVVSYKSCI